jgi:chromosome segregation ATPase
MEMQYADIEIQALLTDLKEVKEDIVEAEANMQSVEEELRNTASKYLRTKEQQLLDTVYLLQKKQNMLLGKLVRAKNRKAKLIVKKKKTEAGKCEYWLLISV